MFSSGGINSSKLKSQLRMASSQMQISSNRKTATLKQNMREISMLLKENPPKEEKAILRTEAFIRDDNLIQAYDMLQLKCSLLTESVKLIELTSNDVKKCPHDILSCIATLIYAQPYIEDQVKELPSIVKQFRSKFGKSFVESSSQNKNKAVNEKIISLLSNSKPESEVVNAYMLQMCKQYEVEWKPRTTVITSVPSISPPPALPPCHPYSSAASAPHYVADTTSAAATNNNTHQSLEQKEKWAHKNGYYNIRPEDVVVVAIPEEESQKQHQKQSARDTKPTPTSRSPMTQQQGLEKRENLADNNNTKKQMTPTIAGHPSKNEEIVAEAVLIGEEQQSSTATTYVVMPFQMMGNGKVAQNSEKNSAAEVPDSQAHNASNSNSNETEHVLDDGADFVSFTPPPPTAPTDEHNNSEIANPGEKESYSTMKQTQNVEAVEDIQTYVIGLRNTPGNVRNSSKANGDSQKQTNLESVSETRSSSEPVTITNNDEDTYKYECDEEDKSLKVKEYAGSNECFEEEEKEFLPSLTASSRVEAEKKNSEICTSNSNNNKTLFPLSEINEEEKPGLLQQQQLEQGNNDDELHAQIGQQTALPSLTKTKSEISVTIEPSSQMHSPTSERQNSGRSKPASITSPSRSNLTKEEEQGDTRKQEKKKQRNMLAAAAGVVGGAAGFVAPGIFVGVAAGVGSAYLAKKISKAIDKQQQQQKQQNAVYETRESSDCCHRNGNAGAARNQNDGDEEVIVLEPSIEVQLS